MKKLGIVMGSVFVALVILVIVCLIVFNFVIYPSPCVLDTTFNSVDIGLKNKEDAIDLIAEEIKNSTYSIEYYDGSKTEHKLGEVISEIDRTEISESLSDIKRFGSLFTGLSAGYLDLTKVVSIDNQKLKEILDKSLEGKEEVQSENASIGYTLGYKKYTIVPERYGNIFVDKCEEVVSEQLKQGYNDINLVELGCYKAPEIVSTNETLLKNLELFNSFKDLVITYNFGGSKENIDISVFNSWIVPNYNDGIILDEVTPFTINNDAVKEYVAELNKKYTTIGLPREFKTSTGEVITITKGDYGWILNRAKMIEDIKNNILAKESKEVDGIFSQKAEQFGENDFTNSYVEVSIANQRVWMYVNGECIVDTPVVTGNIRNGNGTRYGIFSLTYKTRNAVLRGADYETPVKYWMPFDGGIGLHDATWRYSFGGNIYKTNGSHGCVNMPLNAAKTVYENITSTMPIIVW